MFKHFAAAAALIATGFVATQASAVTVDPPKDVDLVFVIDRSGSMDNEGATLADRIGEVMAGISADSRIGSVQAGVTSYLGSSTLVQAITDSVSTLETAIGGISYGGGTENGLGAMRDILPGGSLFGSIGWRPGTVRSIVLLTDEDSDNDEDYGVFGGELDNNGYLNNVIVSDGFSSCVGLGGSATQGGCEYIPTSRPTGGNAAFDLISFTTDTTALLQTFVDTKINEIIITPPPDTTPKVPLPAAGWLMIAGLGGLAMARRKKKA